MPDPTPRPGRPRRLDEAKRREICALISAGCGIKDAAHYVHCAPSTIHLERKRNKEFGDQLRRAELVAQLQPLRAMQQAVGTHWRAAAWMLERTHPERFARHDPRSFGPPQARALMSDVIAIIKDEIPNPAMSDRLEKRVVAAMRYAMRAAWDTQRKGRDLRRAMDYFEQKEASPFDPFRMPGMDFAFSPPPPNHQPTTAQQAASQSTPPNTPQPHSAAKDAGRREVAATFRDRAAGVRPATAANPPGKNSSAAPTVDGDPIPKTV